MSIFQTSKNNPAAENNRSASAEVGAMVIIALFRAIICSINCNIKKECIDTKNGKKYW